MFLIVGAAYSEGLSRETFAAVSRSRASSITQVDQQRPRRRVGIRCRDQHRGFLFVLVRTGDLVRHVGVRIEGPQQVVQRFGLRGIAHQHQRVLAGIGRLARELAHQQQRFLAEARLVDQVEVGTRHQMLED
jgi:hypothetical protein